MASAQRPIERVGMLGLGSMGSGIAASIARRGFGVWGYDPRVEAREALTELGVTACASPAEVARSAELVLAIPFDYRQVEQAVFGPDGVVEGWSSPGLFVVMSTIGPDSARDLERRLAERGHRLIDCPVSGGAQRAAEGTLTLIVGAADADLERCRPVLEACGRDLFHVGNVVGAGQAAKLAHQLLVVVHHVATAEALMLGARSGVEPRQFYELVKTAVGNSVVFEGRGKAMLDRTFKSGGSLSILVKDARLVVGAGQSSDTPLFVAAAATQVFEAARAMGLGEEDDAAVAKLYEALCQQEIRPAS
jgi:3-hydroxyisobutyrate dehydrogenase